MTKHLYLIDGSGFIFRAFHALPPMNRLDGTPVNAVLGFVNIMMKLVQDFKADGLGVIFDAGRHSFRNDIYPEYKANRGDTPEELIPQFPLIREACAAFHIPSVEQVGLEADDLIASYARAAVAVGWSVTIMSSDKDLMQLISPGISLMDPMKNKAIGVPEVMEKFGVGPQQVCEALALIGDASDNVPGVPGIGPKTAAELLTRFGSLRGIFDNLDQISQPKRRQTLEENKDKAFLSFDLVTLRDQCALPLPLEALLIGTPPTEDLEQFLKNQNFTAALQRLHRQKNTSPETHVSLFQGKTQKNPPKEPVDSIVKAPLDLASWYKEIKDIGCVALEAKLSSQHPVTSRVLKLTLVTRPVEADGHAKGMTLDFSIPDHVDFAKKCLEDASVRKVCFDVKPLLSALHSHQILLTAYADVMVMAYVLRHAPAKLDTLMSQYLEPSAPVDLFHEGSLLDPVQALLTLEDVLKKNLEDAGLWSFYQEVEQPLPAILASMEREGVFLNGDKLKLLSGVLEEKMSGLEVEIFDLAGERFNVASPKQLGEIIFGKLKLSAGKKSSKTNAFVTDAETLEDLSAQGHVLPEKVIAWRRLAKLKNTYADALVLAKHPVTQRVHTTFRQCLTNTGRLSSVEPNLQNIPVRTSEGREIRQAFEAKEGYRLVSFDYSQIELRLLAHVSQSPELKEAFFQGKDIHSATAAQMFKVPLDQVTSDLRRRAKAINFGIIYGISAYGLARQTGVSPGEAKVYIQQYLAQYPGIQNYLETTVVEARQKGYVSTPWGRRCYIDGLSDRNGARRQFAERQAINAPLQGGASDVVKKAMIQVADILPKEFPKAALLLQVHDELVFECPVEQVDAFVSRLGPLMENIVSIDVPLKVDASVGENWRDAV